MEQPSPNFPTQTHQEGKAAPKPYNPYTDPLTIFRQGRAYRYADISEVANIVETYFLECDATGKVPSVSGLSLSLGIHRKILWEWEKLAINEDHSEAESLFRACLRDTISRAKERIADWWTPGLMDRDKARGTEFYLKTLGYQDKPDQAAVQNITVNQQNNVLVGNPALLSDLFGGLLPGPVRTALDKPG